MPKFFETPLQRLNRKDLLIDAAYIGGKWISANEAKAEGRGLFDVKKKNNVRPPAARQRL